MNRIAFQTEGFRALREALLRHAPNEAAAVLLAGSAKHGRETRLLVREVMAVPADAYIIQQTAELQISPTFLAPLIKRARTEAASLILAHSHPFSHSPTFSHVDDYGERLIMPTLFGRAPDRPHGALVIGSHGFAARLRKQVDHSEPVTRIEEIGTYVHRYEHSHDDAMPNEIFDRNVRALGAAGQRLLNGLTVAVVGLGGTGSIVTQLLAHLGVGRLILIDDDAVAATNLNRLVGASINDVGRAKVTVAANAVTRVGTSSTTMAIVGSMLDAAKARPVLDADFIFCCTDSHGSRAVVNQIAYQYLVPAIDVGVRIDARDSRVSAIAGRVQMLGPGLPCLVCQGFLDAEHVRRDLLSEQERKRDPYIVGSVEHQPSVVSLNGTISSLAVTMMLSVTTGLPVDARHQIYLADRGIVRTVESKRDPSCVVCSLRGALARGDAWPLPWRLE